MHLLRDVSRGQPPFYGPRGGSTDVTQCKRGRVPAQPARRGVRDPPLVPVDPGFPPRASANTLVNGPGEPGPSLVARAKIFKMDPPPVSLTQPERERPAGDASLRLNTHHASAAGGRPVHRRQQETATLAPEKERTPEPAQAHAPDAPRAACTLRRGSGGAEAPAGSMSCVRLTYI